METGEEISREEKLKKCRELIDEIDQQLIVYKHKEDFEKIEEEILRLEKYLVAFNELFVKYPHRSSLKNLICNLVDESSTGFEVFHAIKTIIQESNYKIYQFCCLSDVKQSIIGSIENAICSYVALISQVQGPEAAAEAYASFSIPKAPTQCATCSSVQKRIAQEQVRFNMMLSSSVIKNHLTITPEDELKVKRELQLQREQEENEDFSEVSDFSCISHLSDDDAFLNEAKFKSVKLDDRYPAHRSTKLEYTAEHAEIKVPQWKKVTKSDLKAEVQAETSPNSSENLSDSVFAERHEQFEKEERQVPEPVRKKSKTSSSRKSSYSSNKDSKPADTQ